MISEQRMRNLTARIREIETRRARAEARLLDTSDAGTRASIEDEILALETDLDDARRELMELTGGDARQQSRDRAVLLLNGRMAELEGRVRVLGEQVGDMQQRLTSWFAADAADRRRGWWLAVLFRLVSLGLMAWAIRLLQTLVEQR